MTLITAGYWQTTYWAENYWMQDYWPEYAVTVGGDSARYYYMQPRIKRKNRKDLLLSIKKLLEALKGD